MRIPAGRERGEPRIVWGRKQTQTEECPKSLVTGESLALLEEFFVRRRLGDRRIRLKWRRARWMHF